MKHTHLIPADFEYYNLDDLMKEKDGNNIGVCWSNGQSEGKNAQAFNIGDIVYIYFHDNRKLTDRILLRAKVCKSDCTDDGSGKEDQDKFLYSEYCKGMLKSDKEIGVDEKEQMIKDAKSKIKGFYLNDFHAISEESEDEFIYIHGSREDAKKGLTGIKGVRINQTKVYLDMQKDNGYEKLKEELENTKFARRLDTLRNKYNNDACILCTDSEKGKHSFKKPNNLYYFEIHHILQQNLNNKLNNESSRKELSWFKEDIYKDEKGINTLVYNDYNEVRLCPYHHKLLHYGTYKERKEKLDKLMKIQDYEKHLKEKIKNEKDFNDIMEYIYKQYDINYK